MRRSASFFHQRDAKKPRLDADGDVTMADVDDDDDELMTDVPPRNPEYLDAEEEENPATGRFVLETTGLVEPTRSRPNGPFVVETTGLVEPTVSQAHEPFVEEIRAEPTTLLLEAAEPATVDPEEPTTPADAPKQKTSLKLVVCLFVALATAAFAPETRPVWADSEGIRRAFEGTASHPAEHVDAFLAHWVGRKPYAALLVLAGDDEPRLRRAVDAFSNTTARVLRFEMGRDVDVAHLERHVTDASRLLVAVEGLEHRSPDEFVLPLARFINPRVISGVSLLDRRLRVGHVAFVWTFKVEDDCIDLLRTHSGDAALAARKVLRRHFPYAPSSFTRLLQHAVLICEERPLSSSSS